MVERQNHSKDTILIRGRQEATPLGRYAHNKKLPLGFLKELGLYDHEEKVAIPYYTTEGELYRTRFRRGSKRWWGEGEEIIPYGLNQLASYKKDDLFCVDEGESDTQTHWHHGFSALGVPGSTTFQSEWAEYVKKFERVYLCQDNDEGGSSFVEKTAQGLKEGGYKGRIYLIQMPEGIKDINELHQADPGTFRSRFLELVQEAELWWPAEENKTQATSKKPTKETTRDLSLLIEDRYFYEEIFVDGELSFLRYDRQTGEITEVWEIPSGDLTILPLTGEEIELGAIILPSGVSEYGDTLTLLRELEEHVYKYLDISDNFRKFTAYYILLSWVYDRLNTLPYLRTLGDTGCGKSRFLDVVGRLCYKPTIVSGCITPAPIYRMIRRWGGTMILDEADLKNSDEYHEVITILNCGFERGRPVIRATKDNPDKLQFLPTFGPKVFATRQRFKDPALEARCLTEIMQETSRVDIPPLLTARFFKEQGELRNKLLLFRFRNWHRTNPEQAANLDLGDIEPRLKQIGGAFGAVFANLNEVLEDFKAFIKEHQRELIEQRAATPVGRVVETLFACIEPDTIDTIDTLDTADGEKLLKISSQDIANHLKDVTPQVVGQILKNLGLKTKLKKIAGENKRCIVFDKAQLKVLARRYILPDQDEGIKGIDGIKGIRTQCKNDIDGSLPQSEPELWEGEA